MPALPREAAPVHRSASRRRVDRQLKGVYMRLKTPLVALSSVGLLTLAACGGSGGSSGPTSTPTFNGGDTGNGQNAKAQGPVTIAGAQKGGIVTVNTLTGLTTTIDP